MAPPNSLTAGHGELGCAGNGVAINSKASVPEKMCMPHFVIDAQCPQWVENGHSICNNALPYDSDCALSFWLLNPIALPRRRMLRVSKVELSPEACFKPNRSAHQRPLGARIIDQGFPPLPGAHLHSENPGQAVIYLFLAPVWLSCLAGWLAWVGWTAAKALKRKYRPTR